MTVIRTAVVCEGERDNPTVLVLDPVDPGDNGELPACWRSLARYRHIVWCRLAVTGALPEVERLLGDPDMLGRPVDVVTSGTVSAAVRGLLARHAGTVRAVLLVDPSGQHGRRVSGVPLRTVGAAAPARPLTGPAVRADVETAIDALDVECSIPAPVEEPLTGA